MNSYLKNLMKEYENINLSTAGIKTKNTYKIIKNFYDIEKNLIKNYLKDENTIKTNQIKDLNQINTNSQKYTKNSNLYLKYMGLDINQKAQEEVNKNINEYKNINQKQVLTSYKEKLSNLYDSYSQKVNENYNMYERTIKNNPYLEKMDESKVAINKGKNVYTLSGKDYKVKNKCGDELYYNIEFKKLIRSQGFLNPTDPNIPNGFMVQINDGILFKVKKNYIYIDGNWYLAKED